MVRLCVLTTAGWGIYGGEKDQFIRVGWAWEAHRVHYLGAERQDLSPCAFPDCTNSEGGIIAIVDPAEMFAESRLVT